MRYALKAVDAANQVVAIELEAHDESAARALARAQGYAVFSVRRQVLARKRRDFPTLLFSIELLALLEAGLNVVEALQALAEKGGRETVLSALLDALRRGESFSTAVGNLPSAFSPLYVATVRSSERTGNLKEALGRYIAYEEELGRVRRKVFSALLYPSILCVAGAAVLAFLLFYVVPRFARVYDDISTPLPFFSAALLTAGAWIERNPPAVLLVACGLGVLAAWAAASAGVRAAIMAHAWRVPGIGERLRICHLARLYRTVAMLLRAGIPALRAFEMVGELLAAHLRHQLGQAMAMLSEGRSISAAMTAVGLATPVATRLLVVGERSGAMGEQMDRIARFYDEETLRTVDAFMRVFEPLLMAGLGVSVGLIVLLMYMPVFELAGSLQ
jgi:general secretion pathway protein F